MKQMVNRLLLMCFLVGLTLTGMAQNKQKFGHINSNDLMAVMPGRDTAEQQLQNYARQLEAQLTKMTAEYESKVAEFQKLPETDNLIRQTMLSDIGQMEQRIQGFQGDAQQAIQEKESVLLEPLLDRAKKAIEDVSKENGYTYIFDSGVGVLLYQPPSDDILPLVKKKLGVTTP